MKPVSVVDFFCGCGGTSVGLRNAGMKIVAGIDCDIDAAATFQTNFPSAKVFTQDVRTLEVEEIAALLPKGHRTLFAGCAPCQPFSAQQKNQSDEDPRRLLLLEFLRFIEALRPDYVMVENVPGLQKPSVGDSGPLRLFTDALNAADYDVSVDVLRAVDYGVPQVRRRLMLVASRHGLARLPEPTHGKGQKSPSTVRDWISNLPPIGAGEVSPGDVDHAAMKLSELNLRRIRATPEGGGRLDWPENLRLECHSKYTGHSDVYGRMAWDRPASGLTTRCNSYSNGRFGHPTQDRAITIREAALLQTFPEDFRLTGSITSKARQIGNAVPPLMAQRAAEALLQGG